MSNAGTIASALAGALAGGIFWAVAWTATVFVDAVLFDSLSRVAPDLDYGGQEGFALMFFALWAGGLVVGATALGVVGSIGAGRRWHRRGMLFGAGAGTVLGGVGGLLAGAGIALTPLGKGNVGTAVALFGAAFLATTLGSAGVYLGGHWSKGTNETGTA